MPTSIGDVMRADDNVDVEPSGAGPPVDPGTTPPCGASTPPPLPPGVPETVTPGAAPPGTCEPVEPCGAESPSPVCAPACDWSVDVRTVVPQPTRARLPASASRAAARARSGTPVTRPTLGTSPLLDDVPTDETAAPRWLSATKSPFPRPQLGDSSHSTCGHMCLAPALIASRMRK